MVFFEWLWLREKCQNTQLFLVRIFPLSDWIRTRINSVFGNFLRCVFSFWFFDLINSLCNLISNPCWVMFGILTLGWCRYFWVDLLFVKVYSRVLNTKRERLLIFGFFSDSPGLIKTTLPPPSHTHTHTHTWTHLLIFLVRQEIIFPSLFFRDQLIYTSKSMC